jgi:hypothetical protein
MIKRLSLVWLTQMGIPYASLPTNRRCMMESVETTWRGLVWLNQIRVEKQHDGERGNHMARFGLAYSDQGREAA